MKPGALHYANGGFLIVQANDILKNYYAWTALKRSMRNRLLKMDDIDVDFRYRVNIFPRPQPVPLKVKLVMIGDDYLYHLLYAYDDDFTRMHGLSIREAFGDKLAKPINAGLLEWYGSALRLTRLGMDLQNSVLVDLM